MYIQKENPRKTPVWAKNPQSNKAALDTYRVDKPSLITNLLSGSSPVRIDGSSFARQ
jgi:hypothetical protein